MIDRKRHLIEVIEDCVLQSLDGNRGKSNTKTSKLHGAFQDYVDSIYTGIVWKHENKLNDGKRSFNIDMYVEGRTKHAAILLKAPTRSLNKNKYNALVNLWGEGVRVALLCKNNKKPLSVLWVSIHPNKDIVVHGKNKDGKGRTVIQDFVDNSPETYNEGYSFIKSANTKCRYVAIPYSYNPTPTLKNLVSLHATMKDAPVGSRIKIKEETWADLDDAIAWLFEGIKP